MIAKSLIAAAALMGIAAFFPAPAAQAGTNVGVIIDVGGGNGGYDGGYDGGWYDDGYGGYDPYDRYDRYDPYRPRPPRYYDDEEITLFITCGEGRRILRQRGFYDVKTTNCKGPNYRYRAWRKGRQFDIRMRNDGQINRVNRID